MNVSEALRAAAGRSIVVGEDHMSRECLKVQLGLIGAAHRRKYRRLGVEVCESGYRKIRGRLYPGLEDILKYLNTLDGIIPPRLPSGTPIENMYYLVQEALWYEWDVVPVDPSHWDWLKGVGFGRRDTRMAARIASGGPMVAIVGAAHLKGLHRKLGSSVLFVRTYQPNSHDWRGAGKYLPHLQFLRNVPVLTL